MNKSESIAGLSAALTKAQAEIKPAFMNAVNPFLKNKYADLGSVIEVARAPLAKYGLSFVQLVGGDGNLVTLETVLIHTSGEWISETVAMPIGEDKGRSAAQSMGAIVTYLRRYSLSACLGIYADEDTDGEKPMPSPQNPVIAKSNGDKTGRPLAPDALAEAINRKAAAYADREATDKQRGLCAGMLSQIFAEDIDRHAVQEFLFGTSSLSDAADGMILAALDWLKPTQDSGGAYLPDPMACKEAQTVLSHVLTKQGQQALNL